MSFTDIKFGIIFNPYSSSLQYPINFWGLFAKPSISKPPNCWISFLDILFFPILKYLSLSRDSKPLISVI